MSQWQPIETAPKDGTQIILFFPTYPLGEQVGAYQFDNTVEPIWDARDGYQLAEGEDAPTHWMPLPPAPEVLHVG